MTVPVTRGDENGGGLASTIIGFSSISLLNEPNSVKNHVKIMRRIAPAELRCIYQQMHEQLGALHMPQKLNAQAVFFMRAFNQPWNIGQHKGSIPRLHNSQIRFQSRKRNTRYLRLGRGQSRNQSRLPRVRKSYQANIRQQLQFKSQPNQFTGLAVFMFGRSLAIRNLSSR